MELFEANPKYWKAIPNGKKFYQKIVDSDKLKRCLCKYSKECAMVYSRIGSPSYDAEVYSVRIDDNEYAAKVIPIIDNKSEDKIRNELYFARKTSEAVMEGIVSHFLVYYGGYDCKNTIYKEDSKFNLVSQKYSLIKKVVSRMNKFDKKRVSRELEALSFDEVKDLYPDVEYNVESTVLFSQMLWGDVRTYLEKPRSEKEWNLIIDQIILCAKELEILDIGHNDLHLGNLLIKDINTLELVVHDYGRSSEGYNKDDFGGALDALTKSNPPLKVLNRINKIS